jgi:hypothetical protein
MYKWCDFKYTGNNMKKLIYFAVALAVLSTAAYAGAGKVMNEKYPSATLRYRMTVTMDTPEGPKTGSAVREVTLRTAPVIDGLSGPRGWVKGEAVVVDLGKRGVLFALLRGGPHTVDYGWNILFDAFPHDAPLSPEGVRYYGSLKSGKVTLTPDLYPMLVKFKDLKDPKTVQAIYPINGKSGPDEFKSFEDVFGNGVKIYEINLEISNDPIIFSINSWLPWLQGIRSNIDGTLATTSTELSNYLDVGAFQQGEKQ